MLHRVCWSFHIIVCLCCYVNMQTLLSFPWPWLILFNISGGIYGAAWSALRIPDPHPTPLILQSFILMKNNSILVGGAASLFALTTCTAASMREKDDHFNWALGGAASGVLIGFSKSSWGLGCGLATAFAAAGALAKYSGVYKHPLRTDRVYVWCTLRLIRYITLATSFEC